MIMKSIKILIITWSIILIAGSVYSDNEPKKIGLPKSDPPQQMGWIKNEGQHPNRVAFTSFSYGGQIAVDHSGKIGYYLQNWNNEPVMFSELLDCPDNSTIQPTGKDEQITRVNYFIGKEDNFVTNVPCYGFLEFKEVWPGIQLSLRSTNAQIEKVFLLDPGADPNQIQIQPEGILDICVDEDQQLQIDHESGSYFFTKPIAWQEIEGQRSETSIEYKTRSVGDRFYYGFELGKYDRNYPVIIDPVLASTYIGGTNYESSSSLDIDDSGSAYFSGTTYSSTFPTTSGAFNTTAFEERNAFVAKFSSDLSTLEACTFLGGDDIDILYDMTLDKTGKVILTGSTKSENFPTTIGAYDRSYNGSQGSTIDPYLGDIFLSKLSNDLSTLEASTYIGGENREWGSCLLVNDANEVYVSGVINSDLPVSSVGLFQGMKNGTFFIKMDNTFSNILLYNAIDVSALHSGPTDMCFDAWGNLVVVGTIGSLDDLPVPAGCYDNSLNGFLDGFLCKMNPNLSQILGASYFGGAKSDYINGVCTDNMDYIYITGSTYSNPFPITPSAYDTEHDCSISNYDAFVSKFDPGLNNLVASTYLGATSSEEFWWVNADDSGNSIIHDQGSDWLYIAGTTSGSNFPVTCKSIDDIYRLDEAFVAKMNTDLNVLDQATFFGGSQDDIGINLAFNPDGDILLSGTTESTDLTIVNGYADQYIAEGDLFVAKLTSDLINYTPCCTYAMPADAVWVDTDCSLTIQWELSQDATGYYLSVGTEPGVFDLYDQMDVGDVDSYNLQYLPNESIIYFKIDAYNEFGISQGFYCIPTNITTKSPRYFYEAASICEGDTFQWEGFPMTMAGHYEVLHYGSDGCDSIVHLDLEVTPCFHQTATKCINEGESYSWFDQEYVEPGIYYKHFTTESGCDSIFELILEFCETVDSDALLKKDESLRIFPNPVVNGQFTIELRDIDPTGFLQLIDLSGKQIWAKHATVNSYQVNCRDLASGIYLLKWSTQNRMISKKVIISR